MFYELNYMNSGLKLHIIEESLKEKAIQANEEKHQAKPSETKIVAEALLDPGGMISMVSKPKILEINNFAFSVKPEHILSVSYIWDKTLKKVQVDDAILYKVYFNYSVWIVTEDTYQKVQKWLTSLYSDGLLAEDEIYESLKDCKNIVLPQRKSVGEA